MRAVLAAGLGLLAGCGPFPKGDPARPDIVLVSIDTLRRDHLGAYGYKRATSPNLDALAARGLRFANARSASPWTLPSHLTMFTGLWPLEHQVVEDDLALAPDVPVVTEALQKAGYATAAFVSTFYVSGDYGFARGFDTYQDYDITERLNLAHAVRVDRLVADATRWMKENSKGKPVFLFLHIYDVHYPYYPPPPWDEKFDRAGSPTELKYRTYKYYLKHPLNRRRLAHQVAQYDESIAWVDDELGGLVEAWEDSNRPAYWIVTADHGEEFGERGSWGHAHTLYPEALDIPLIVAGPGIAPSVREERTGTIDVAATIAGMAGLTWEGAGVDLRGSVPERTFYAETSRFDSARLSVEEGRRRLDLDLAGGTRAVFDRRKDRGEKAPLADDPAADLEGKLWAAVGEGWTNDAPVTTTGWFTRGGVLAGTSLDAPGTFGVYPPDAEVTGGGFAVRGSMTAPTEGPLRYAGPRRARVITVDDDTRAKLEALGYVQTAEGAPEEEEPAEEARADGEPAP